MREGNEFREDIDSQDADPLDSKSQEFDWAEVYSNLGEARSELPCRDYDALSQALKRVMQWLADVDLKSPHAHKTISRRVLAFLWVLNPAYFDGLSLTKVAALIGAHKATLSPHAAQASREFGIRNRGQSHAWNLRMDRKPADA